MLLRPRQSNTCAKDVFFFFFDEREKSMPTPQIVLNRVRGARHALQQKATMHEDTPTPPEPHFQMTPSWIWRRMLSSVQFEIRLEVISHKVLEQRQHVKMPVTLDQTPFFMKQHKHQEKKEISHVNCRLKTRIKAPTHHDDGLPPPQNMKGMSPSYPWIFNSSNEVGAALTVAQALPCAAKLAPHASEGEVFQPRRPCSLHHHVEHHRKCIAQRKMCRWPTNTRQPLPNGVGGQHRKVHNSAQHVLLPPYNCEQRHFRERTPSAQHSRPDARGGQTSRLATLLRCHQRMTQ